MAGLTDAEAVPKAKCDVQSDPPEGAVQGHGDTHGPLWEGTFAWSGCRMFCKREKRKEPTASPRGEHQLVIKGVTYSVKLVMVEAVLEPKKRDKEFCICTEEQ